MKCIYDMEEEQARDENLRFIERAEKVNKWILRLVFVLLLVVLVAQVWMYLNR